LATGCQSGELVVEDIRTDKTASCYQLHERVICGLAWNPTKDNLIATGGNDNQVNICDLRKGAMVQITHGSAVKAIDWKGSRLVTGGGTNDRRIRVIDSDNHEVVGCVDTGSQICSLLFS
jgi:cell division cycle 20-like protein 1 (cofactor of APC complex)